MPVSPRSLRLLEDPEKKPFPPDCAARFRAESVIASGGFGTVWRATQLELERPVAIQLLHAVLGSTSELLDTQARRLSAAAAAETVADADRLLALLGAPQPAEAAQKLRESHADAKKRVLALIAR